MNRLDQDSLDEAHAVSPHEHCHAELAKLETRYLAITVFVSALDAFVNFCLGVLHSNELYALPAIFGIDAAIGVLVHEEEQMLEEDQLCHVLLGHVHRSPFIIDALDPRESLPGTWTTLVEADWQDRVADTPLEMLPGRPWAALERWPTFCLATRPSAGSSRTVIEIYGARAFF